MTEEHEGYSDEKPAADELGKPGTPGSGLTAEAPHAVDAEHDDDGGHGHGHEESNLGPIDWRKWGYAIVGGVAGVIVVAMFWMALGGLPS
jgi:hypothetical protein